MLRAALPAAVRPPLPIYPARKRYAFPERDETTLIRLIFNSVPARSKIKCAAGTLRAYLRRRTDDAFASFVSRRSLSVRGSWGTAPSVFWHGAPGGTQGPLGKGGAAERWRVAYPIGIATRHGAKPATTRTHKRNAPPARRTGRHPAVTPRRRQATTNSHNKSQSHSPNKIHYLCDLRPVFPHFVNLP